MNPRFKAKTYRLSSEIAFFKWFLHNTHDMANLYEKIKKSPRCIAGGLEFIFVVIDHKMCSWGTFWVVLLFKFFATNLLQINLYRIYFKIIYFWPPGYRNQGGSDLKFFLSDSNSSTQNYPKSVMGNPNRFEGQIFAKKSCRGPKYRLLLYI